jgi:hypothetical protein
VNGPGLDTPHLFSRIYELRPGLGRKLLQRPGGVTRCNIETLRWAAALGECQGGDQNQEQNDDAVRQGAPPAAMEGLGHGMV